MQVVSRVLTGIRHINSQRHEIPDVPVLYLVEPTESNLKRIAVDLAQNLYADAYVNFLYSISRPAMEEFAADIAMAGTSESIAQVFDQYLNFIVAEPDLFSLVMGRETFWALNSATTEDEKLDSMIDRIVTGLFSVAVTMGRLPNFRTVTKDHAETDVARLDTYHSVSQERPCGSYSNQA